MSTQQAEILLICGSPRAHTSEALLALLEQGIREAGARTHRFLLSQKHIDPCIGCGCCEKTGTCILAVHPTDDYLELLDALKHADALAVVSPLFFAGPPAQLKALYDRLQPFWARKYILGQKIATKRPAQIFILGGGGDAHGYEPMVTISRSALAVAGFSLEKVQNFIGFKYAKDVPALPTDKEAASMAFGELAHLRKAVALQQQFEQRAVAAGGAFARFVSKSLVKQELQAELQMVEAEMVELQSDTAFVEDAPLEEVGVESKPVKVINQLDSEFETLKQTARAAKSSQAHQVELKAAIEEAVVAMTERSADEDESHSDNVPTDATDPSSVETASASQEE